MMEAAERHPSSANRVAIDAILDSENIVQPAAAEIIGPSYNDGPMSPPPKPNSGHTRPLSFSTRNSNRLSLSFPIQLPDREMSARQMPTYSTATASQSLLPKEMSDSPAPKDSTGFMVALASQERRVLELKEDLHRAEGELKKLKRQWAVHESSKKRAEIKHIEQLHPMQMTTTDIVGGMDEVASLKRSVELDRRKALLANITKDSRRKIITGGHTRTLSLLSPERASYDAYPPPSSTVSAEKDSTQSTNAMPRSATMPNTSQGITKISSNRVRHSYHDSATSGVKQIAEDIKTGLWTFMEDLRQATVGEEAIKGPPNPPGLDVTPTISTLKQSGQGNLAGNEPRSNRLNARSKSTFRSLDTGGNLCKGKATLDHSEHDLANPRVQTPSHKSSTVPSSSAVLDDDDWANWDSPVSKSTSPRWSNSTTLSSQDSGGTPGMGSPPNNLQIDPDGDNSEGTPKHDDITWATLTNLTPSNLKRTASAIMKEWERSLTLPSDVHKDSVTAPTTGKKMENEQEARFLLNNLP